MHELLSTGCELGSFASWQSAPEGEAVNVETEAGRMKITTRRSLHSECCFGACVQMGDLRIGWTADSGFSQSLLDALSRSHLLIVDARKVGGPEHASFQDIVEYVSSREDVAFLGVNPQQGVCQVAVLGYGSQAQVPQDELPPSAVLKPGDVIAFCEDTLMPCRVTRRPDFFTRLCTWCS
ncbi:unnamed protein product [Effrenium voratum]|nr:unnamed protein product [Effrenium voratum]